jgi:Predicted redox protein, regulator of disulfide bond formation
LAAFFGVKFHDPCIWLSSIVIFARKKIMSVEIRWKNNKTFEADINGHKVLMDVPEEMGGDDNGPRPKPLLLAALGGCSGLDVVAILKKMKVEVESFSMSVVPHMTQEIPQYYDKIHITYKFKGENLSIDKLNKAVQLSQEQYCGVAAMLRKAAMISYSIEII